MEAKEPQPIADCVLIQLHILFTIFAFEVFVANMKVSILCSATLFTWATFAFPTNLLKGDISEATLAEITSLTETITRDLETKRQGGHVKRTFSAEAQRISTTGDHRYACSSINMSMLHYSY